MTYDEMSALLDTLHVEEREVRAAGHAEYARDGADTFANFKRIASLLGLTPEQVLLVYAYKHLDGIIAYINGHTSQREDVRGRIGDLRLYLALLRGLIEDREHAQAS